MGYWAVVKCLRKGSYATVVMCWGNARVWLLGGRSRAGPVTGRVPYFATGCGTADGARDWWTGADDLGLHGQGTPHLALGATSLPISISVTSSSNGVGDGMGRMGQVRPPGPTAIQGYILHPTIPV